MYQNCCKKCGSASLHTETKGNNTGLYCDECGAWIKWLGKDELKAFEYSEYSQKKANDSKSESTKIIATNQYAGMTTYKNYQLNLDKINSVDDCKKLIKFLCNLTIKPLPSGCEYNDFDDVREYFDY